MGLLPSLALLILFLTVDLAFFGSNLMKILHGGWIPVVIAIIILTIMTTWKRGRLTLARVMAEAATAMDSFFDKIKKDNPHRVKGTAVFMTLTKDIAPSVLLHHYKHNRVLHEKVILLSISTEHLPEVPSFERVRVTDLELGFVKVVARYGYMETPNVEEILKRAEGTGLVIDYQRMSYYLGRESFVTTGDSGMAKWRKALFIFLSRNARPATEYFNLPPDKVIEIGSQVTDLSREPLVALSQLGVLPWVISRPGVFGVPRSIPRFPFSCFLYLLCRSSPDESPRRVWRYPAPFLPSGF